MFSQIEPYMNFILQERNGYWSVAAVIYMIAALWLRGLFIHPVTEKAKEAGKKDFTRVKKFYLSRSIPGWIFFFVSVFFAILIWLKGLRFPLDGVDARNFLGLLATFLLSVIFHLHALGTALGSVLVEHQDDFKQPAPPDVD